MYPELKSSPASLVVSRRAAFLLLLVALLVVPLPGCGGEDEEEPGDAQLGTLEIKHTITVDDMVIPVEPEGDQPRPMSGMQFVRLDVSVNNDSSREFIISPANLKLETEDGAAYSVNLEFVDEELLPTVITVEPGGSVSGSVIYEIPADAIPAALLEDLDGRQTRFELPR